MANRPKVSVIIPCYNVEKFLDRCLNSIVNQTLSDLEIILVDDKSLDGTPHKCDEWSYKDPRVSVIHKPTNEGLGLARNSGLFVARGEYVAFVDADDYVELDMYETLFQECLNHKLDCIYSEFNVSDYPGFRVVLRPEHLYDGSNEIESLRLDIVGSEPSYISGVKYHCSSCKGLYSLSVIKDNNLSFHSERQYISEDLIFNLDFLFHATRVKIVPSQYYHYCLNGSSITHSYRPDKFKKLVIMLQALASDTTFSDKKEFELRLKRTAIFYSMSGIRQEKYRKDISFFKKTRNIKAIEQTKEIENAINDYPINKLPIKWKIYAFLLKHKLLHFTYIVIV